MVPKFVPFSFPAGNPCGGEGAVGTLPEAIARGESEELTITFEPSGLETQEAVVQIVNNDHDEGSYFFKVRGNGRPVLPERTQITSRLSFSRTLGAGGGVSGRMEFQSQSGKSYRIVTTTDLETWEPIPELTGITGLGDLIDVDLSAYLPSETNLMRFFRVEEE